ncbi:MAG: ATP-binding protein [Lachnospiraceae bacterium]|nr:ATP-binding protein [Lachnospiraceae bacterium]
MKEIRVRAKAENLNQVYTFMNEQLLSVCLDSSKRAELDMVVEEIFINVASYAYEGEPGYVTVQMDLLTQPDRIWMSFIDDGIPYNPLDRKDPDITLSAEERQVGGLGIYLVKKIMDKVEYQYMEEHNILTIERLV